ncbi:MAG: glycosyltransferase family 2 protein [Candidatus Hodarchaeota archaeon]
MTLGVILPTSNRGKLLEIILHNYSYLISKKIIDEIIIIDDGSTDNTKKILESFHRKFPTNSKIIRNLSRKGAPNARNKGLELLKSEFVLFGEDDVIIPKSYVFQLKERMKNFDCAILGGRITYISGSLIGYKLNKNHKEIFNSNLLMGNFSSTKYKGPVKVPFLHGIVIYPSKKLKNIGFDTSYKGNGFREETDPQIHLSMKGCQVIFFPDITCYHLPFGLPGGQHQIGAIETLYWTIKNNFYFMKKFSNYFEIKIGIKHLRVRIILFAFWKIIETFSAQFLSFRKKNSSSSESKNFLKFSINYMKK